MKQKKIINSLYVFVQNDLTTTIGHSYRLQVAAFNYIDNTIYQKRVARENTYIIEDYESPSMR